MICYRDRTYCGDAAICPVLICSFRLTEAEANRAITFGLPVAWMDYKDFCAKYKEATK